MAEPTALQALPEDWDRALAIVAHPDDLEYGAAAAVARWTDAGKSVAYCVATSGEAGIDAIPPEQAGPLREAEQRAAAALVGVRAVEFLGFADGVLEYGLSMRHSLSAAIRRHQPDVVVTTNYRETWGFGMLNQADHIAVGRSVIDAIRDAANRWVFQDILDDGVEPWGGVRRVFVAASPHSEHAVDVTDTFDRGMASLHAHAAYLRGLGPDAEDPQPFLESMARAAGGRLGCELAIPFEVIEF